MRLLKLVAVVGILATGLVQGITPPATATHKWVPPVDRSPLPSLARKTIVEGDTSTWMRVHLPRTTAVSTSTTVEGDGRIVGLYLFKETNGRVAPGHADLDVVRFGRCGEPGCEADPMTAPSAGWKSGDGKLSAGTYRLYLIADGAPASVEIRLPGLTGGKRLRPSKPAPAKIVTFEPQITEQDGGPVYSAGGERPFQGQGVSFMAQWFDNAGAGAAAYGYCLHDDAAPADPATGYMPPECPVQPSANAWVRYFTPAQQHVMGFELWLDTMPAAMGSWYAASAPIAEAATVALWLKTGRG